MAIYRYVCNNEECETDLFQKMRPMSESSEPAPCPQCESECHRSHDDLCKNSFVTGMYTARTGYGLYDASGRPMPSSVSANSLASSTASKSHKK